MDWEASNVESDFRDCQVVVLGGIKDVGRSEDDDGETAEELRKHQPPRPACPRFLAMIQLCQPTQMSSKELLCNVEARQFCLPKQCNESLIHSAVIQGCLFRLEFLDKRRTCGREQYANMHCDPSLWRCLHGPMICCLLS